MTSGNFFSLVSASVLRGAVTIAIGLAVSTALGTSVQAKQLKKPSKDAVHVYLVKYKSDDGYRYTKKSFVKVSRTSYSQYRTSNSYVCTPSGFGQRARCYTPGLFM